MQISHNVHMSKTLHLTVSSLYGLVKKNAIYQPLVPKMKICIMAYSNFWKPRARYCHQTWSFQGRAIKRSHSNFC